jgi:hypothetical protein
VEVQPYRYSPPLVSLNTATCTDMEKYEAYGERESEAGERRGAAADRAEIPGLIVSHLMVPAVGAMGASSGRGLRSRSFTR